MAIVSFAVTWLFPIVAIMVFDRMLGAGRVEMHRDGARVEQAHPAGRREVD
jgi:hypothetical protein